jgi:hypothetical protein
MEWSPRTSFKMLGNLRRHRHEHFHMLSNDGNTTLQELCPPEVRTMAPEKCTKVQ